MPVTRNGPLGIVLGLETVNLVRQRRLTTEPRVAQRTLGKQFL